MRGQSNLRDGARTVPRNQGPFGRQSHRTIQFQRLVEFDIGDLFTSALGPDFAGGALGARNFERGTVPL